MEVHQANGLRERKIAVSKYLVRMQEGLSHKHICVCPARQMSPPALGRTRLTQQVSQVTRLQKYM